MAARARPCTLIGLLSAALLVAYTVFSFAATQAVLDEHNEIAAAGVTHHGHASAENASHDGQAGHCHPGLDCFLAEMLLTHRFEAPPRASLSDWRMPAGAFFTSADMSPQPPPPRTG